MVPSFTTNVPHLFFFQWVELSFNQVLVTWSIEASIHHSTSPHPAKVMPMSRGISRNQRELIMGVMAELPVFNDQLEISVQLPHPASGIAKKQKMIRANSLATLTAQMVEMIMDAICQKAKASSFNGVSTIRCGQRASKVSIKRDSKAVLVQQSDGGIVKDKPIDNVEYIAVFGLGPFDQFSIVNSTQLFFKEAFEVRPTQDTVFAQVSTHAFSLYHYGLHKQNIAEL